MILIIANSYPTRAHGIIVNYTFVLPFTINECGCRLVELLSRVMRAPSKKITKRSTAVAKIQSLTERQCYPQDCKNPQNVTINSTGQSLIRNISSAGLVNLQPVNNVSPSISPYLDHHFVQITLKCRHDLKIGKFTVMTILNFHLQPQFKYELFHIYFSNSLIIHQVKTKKFTTMKEVWIPGLNQHRLTI